MTRHALHTLIALIVGLVLLLFVLERTDDRDVFTDEQLLLPGFAAHANDVSEVRVSRGADDHVTLRHDDDAWRISDRDGYLADVGKLRQLVIALAEAAIVEDKTSNPEFYERLGLDDPAEGGEGTKIALSGADFSYTVILGDEAQRDYRYARVPDQPTSYLIDRNPDIPEEAGDWLVPDIIDLKSDVMRRVAITHADGERIVIDKSARDLTDFTVLDIPEGRELSYATVGNGIAGALSSLTLDDVRAAADATPTAVTVFETWHGLRVTATTGTDEDVFWVSFLAEAVPVAAEPAAEAAATATTEDDGAAAEQPVSAEDQARELNERLSGWQYRLPDYKNNLLIRRWDDLLTDEPDE